MIFIGGGGVGLLAVLALFVLLLGGGDAFPLLLLLLFVGVPFLLFRTMRRAALAQGAGWAGPHHVEVPQQPWQASWHPPQQPVLPPVDAADVSSLRDRLGHDVRSLEPGGDAVSRQAMADASERYSTASALLERATTDAQLRTAWLAAVEGLHATRVVRQRQGLDAGPPVPALPGTGAQLTAPTRIEMNGRSYAGSPSYAPGRPHWFPGGEYGGRHVPGGWYDVPFWPSALVLGGLGGWALGGLMAGAMYGDDLHAADTYGGGFGDGYPDDGGGFGGFGGGGGWDDGGGGGDWGGDGGGGGWDGGGGGDW